MQLLRGLVLLSILGLAALFVFLFSRTQVINWDEHERYVTSLVRVDAVNADLNKNILKVRYRLLEYYDILVSQISMLKLLQNSLSTFPSVIDQAGQEELQKPLSILVKLAGEKETLIESFKAQNAVLKNSVRYLPSVLDEVKEAFDDTALTSQLEVLIRDVLQYSQDADNKPLAKRVWKQLQGLEALRNEYHYKDETQPDTLDRILAHSKTVFTHAKTVNTLADTLTWLPIGQWSSALNQTYTRHHKRALSSVDRSWRYVYICGAGLLLYVFILLVQAWRKPTSGLATSPLLDDVEPRIDDTDERAQPQPSKLAKLGVAGKKGRK